MGTKWDRKALSSKKEKTAYIFLLLHPMNEQIPFPFNYSFVWERKWNSWRRTRFLVSHHERQWVPTTSSFNKSSSPSSPTAQRCTTLKRFSTRNTTYHSWSSSCSKLIRSGSKFNQYKIGEWRKHWWKPCWGCGVKPILLRMHILFTTIE